MDRSPLNRALHALGRGLFAAATWTPRRREVPQPKARPVVPEQTAPIEDDEVA